MTYHPCINCDPDSSEDLAAEVKQEESTKWAKLVVAIGYPYDTSISGSEDLLDDDMLHELAVAWKDSELAGHVGEGSPTEIEDYEDSIRLELGVR